MAAVVIQTKMGLQVLSLISKGKKESISYVLLDVHKYYGSPFYSVYFCTEIKVKMSYDPQKLHLITLFHYNDNSIMQLPMPFQFSILFTGLGYRLY